MSKFQEELAALINKHSVENGSDTPDYILAKYMIGCLEVFERTITVRELWYGRGNEEVSEPIKSQLGDSANIQYVAHNTVGISNLPTIEAPTEFKGYDPAIHSGMCNCNACAEIRSNADVLLDMAKDRQQNRK